MKIRFLWWLKGWTHLLDALIIIFSLGNYDLDYTSKCNEMILKELFNIYRREYE